MRHSIYILDDWEDAANLRPWAYWFSQHFQCAWDENVTVIGDPDHNWQPGVIIVHWSSVIGDSVAVTHSALLSFCRSQPTLTMVVISAPPSVQNEPPSLFYRRTGVGDDYDDPFPSYVAEFAAHLSPETAHLDASLLEPEPFPHELRELQTLMSRNDPLPDPSDPVWARVQFQVARILKRGDGLTPHHDDLIPILEQTWPSAAFSDNTDRLLILNLMRRALELHGLPRQLKR